MKITLATKVDKDIKIAAQALAKELGIPLSFVINAQLREFVRSGRLVLDREKVIKPEILKEIIAASNKYHSGDYSDFSKEFDSIDELFINLLED